MNKPCETCKHRAAWRNNENAINYGCTGNDMRKGLRCDGKSCDNYAKDIGEKIYSVARYFDSYFDGYVVEGVSLTEAINERLTRISHNRMPHIEYYVKQTRETEK